MSWLNRIWGTTVRKPEPESEPDFLKESIKKFQEQVNPTSFAGADYSTTGTEEDQSWGYRATGGSEEDWFWRRLDQSNWYQKDMMPQTYLEIHNLVYEAYHANPLAFAIIELTNSFVLGKGVTIDAKNKRVKKVLMDFWENNEMDERITNICNELALYGELFVRFFVNQFSGEVKIRLTDPSFIDLIETDPEDIETPLRFHRRPIGQSISMTDPPQPEPMLKLVKNDASIQGEWYQAGTEMVQFAINKVSNAKRGNSDLAPILPWLRRYKDWLIDRVRINKYKSTFMWDVTLKGADAKTINAKAMDYAAPPEAGSVIIHNEAEEWKAVQPNINAMDAKEDGRAIKLMVAVGASVPEHYLSDQGSSGNRATAAEMGLPTLLKFIRRQKKIRSILRCILDRVIAEAQHAGKLGATINTEYDILMPEIDASDNQIIGAGTNAMTQALSLAKAQGWISDETAMRILFETMGQEIDVHSEKEQIQAQSTPNQQKQGITRGGEPSPENQTAEPTQHTQRTATL